MSPSGSGYLQVKLEPLPTACRVADFQNSSLIELSTLLPNVVLDNWLDYYYQPSFTIFSVSSLLNFWYFEYTTNLISDLFDTLGKICYVLRVEAFLEFLLHPCNIFHWCQRLRGRTFLDTFSSGGGLHPPPPQPHATMKHRMNCECCPVSLLIDR